MAFVRLPQVCPACESPLRIERIQCTRCDTRVEGDFLVPRLARLSREDQNFLELFILASGSLKTVSNRLKISYPTVRRRLDDIVAGLEAEIRRDEERRQDSAQEANRAKGSGRDSAEPSEKL